MATGKGPAPRKGWVYDSRSRGWYNATYRSYTEAKAHGEAISRRQTEAEQRVRGERPAPRPTGPQSNANRLTTGYAKKNHLTRRQARSSAEYQRLKADLSYFSRKERLVYNRKTRQREKRERTKAEDDAMNDVLFDLGLKDEEDMIYPPGKTPKRGK